MITPLIALLASLLVIWTIRYLDVVEREPRKMIARALGTGCPTAIVASVWCQFPLAFWQGMGLGEQFVDFMSTVVDAPIWEELIKGAGLICLYRSKREKFDSLTDFVAYACAVAIGFELIENIFYQWGQLEGKDQLGAWMMSSTTGHLVLREPTQHSRHGWGLPHGSGSEANPHIGSSSQHSAY
jgi:RsiW-degrading membrane proteinase PrsW (M82 family)